MAQLRCHIAICIRCCRAYFRHCSLQFCLHSACHLHNVSCSPELAQILVELMLAAVGGPHHRQQVQAWEEQWMKEVCMPSHSTCSITLHISTII